VSTTFQQPRAPSLIGELLGARIISDSEGSRLTQLDVVTRADLEFALIDQHIASEMDEQVARRLDGYVATADPLVIPLGRAQDLLHALVMEIVAAAPELTAIEPAGDVRRFDVLATNLVIVARAADPASALGAIAAALSASDILHRAPGRLLIVYQHHEIDIRVASPETFGTVLFTTTGSATHYRQMLTRRAERRPCEHEIQIYAQAGLPWIPPELREGAGEIEAAAGGRLPSLVERRHIRGDLHMHSTYSDGRDSVSVMVEACHSLGYEYIAITDHSQNAAASRTLGANDIAKQRDEIARLREAHPSVSILQGVEVDILPDGSLDFPDSILERFDIVLASLHERAGHDGARLTERCVAAMRHPLVNVITHPANRLVGRREGYPLDFDAIYSAAVETGTALEVDGAPSHLDLDGDHARAAIEAGVTLTIDSDCHRADALDRQMRLAVGIARRGWVEPSRVLNTRPLEGVLAFISDKRRSSRG
jgi:DNA polymerase (family 10)